MLRASSRSPGVLGSGSRERSTCGSVTGSRDTPRCRGSAEAAESVEVEQLFGQPTIDVHRFHADGEQQPAVGEELLAERKEHAVPEGTVLGQREIDDAFARPHLLAGDQTDDTV